MRCAVCTWVPGGAGHLPSTPPPYPRHARTAMAAAATAGTSRTATAWPFAVLAYALLLSGLLPSSLWPWPGHHLLQQHHASSAAPPARDQQQQQQSGDGGAASRAFAAVAALVVPHGYSLQEAFVTTQDGYVLRLHRILAAAGRSASGGSGSNATRTTTRSSPVVFLQHALMDSSAGWLLLGPRRALALQLADAGFDVWLGNSRGNRFSRNHTHLQPHEPAYWAYSWQQQAEYDLPASISHVLSVTQQRSLVLVGYSQGSMTTLATLASQPALASRVSLALLLAPVAFTTAVRSPLFLLSSRLHLDVYGLRSGWLEWGSHQPVWGTVCSRLPRLCLLFLTSFCGANPRDNIDASLLPRVFEHLPAGTSVRVMSHWAQSIRRGSTASLHQYDYGSDCSSASTSTSTSSSSSSSRSRPEPGFSHSCNLEAYGQAEPPAYHLAAITTPLALFSGGRDTISTLTDVELLKQRLAPGVLQQHLHIPDWAHLDFELGSDAPSLLYPQLLQLAREFSSSTQEA